MDIRQFRYFVKIIELKSFTRAAEHLRIAQPALGLQIRNLEAELNTQLLIRHSRGVEPTEGGKLLLERARLILDQVDETKRLLTDLSGVPRGKITLGMTPSINFIFAASLVRRCQADLPNVSLNIVEGLSPVLNESVQSDRLDIALTYDAPADSSLARRPLFDEEVFFVESPAKRGPRSPTIEFSEIATRPLVMPGMPHGLRRLLEDGARDNHVELNIAFEIQSVAAVRELVEQRIAATILPFGAVSRPVTEGRLVARRIVSPTISRTVWLVYSNRRPLSNAEASLLTIVEDLAANQIGKTRGVTKPKDNSGSGDQNRARQGRTHRP